MATPGDNSELVDRIEKDFVKVIKRLQRSILAVALGSLTSYVTDSGRLSFRVSNINRANRVALRINARAKRGRSGLLSFILDALGKLFDANRDYYRETGNPTQSAEDEARRRVLLLYGYDLDKGEVVSGGYLDQVLDAGQVGSQVSNVINQALASRSTLRELRTRLRAALSPATRQGLVEAQYTRLTRDLFAEYDRAVKFAYKERLGLKYAIYAGTEMDETRDFCAARYNLVFSEAEIASWNAEEWQGKKPGPVEIVCGGYNCRHSLNWITDELAETLIDRQGGVDQLREVE